MACDIYALCVTWWEVVTLFAYNFPTDALVCPESDNPALHQAQSLSTKVG
jgi:hypothetical protein|eukprot:SAG25_NODE_14_length_24446_cov_22.033678_7_plen_50_part_00